MKTGSNKLKVTIWIGALIALASVGNGAGALADQRPEPGPGSARHNLGAATDASFQTKAASILAERGEIFMLAALAHTHRFSSDSEKIGYNISAILAWNVTDIDHTPDFLIERNRNIEYQGEIFHAEVNALRAAYKTSFDARKVFATDRSGGKFKNTTIYTTLEPCPMCASTLLMAQVPTGYFCMEDPELRDEKTHEVVKHSVAHAYGRNIEISQSSLDLCRDINRDLWKAVDEIGSGQYAGAADISSPPASDGKRRLFLISYLAKREEMIFKKAFDRFKTYRAKYSNNSELLEKLRILLEKPSRHTGSADLKTK